MDSDDLCSTDRIEKQFKRAVRHRLAVVGSNADIIDDTMKVVATRKYPEGNRQIRKAFWRPFNRSVILPGTILAHASIFQSTKYSEAFRIMTDWDFILKVGDNPDVVFENVQEPLYKYRVNQGSMSLNSPIRNRYNLMVWYNQIQRKFGRSEAVSLQDFECKMKRNIFSFSIYNILLTAKAIQRQRYAGKQKRRLGMQ
jgi:hypothetical protein